MSQRFASLTILCVLLSPARVLGESRPSMLADYLGEARSGSFELELGWFTRSDEDESLHALTPVVSGRVPVADQFDLELDWPFAFVSASYDADPDDGIDEFRSGNPLFAGYYVSRRPDGYLRVGLGVALPFANGDDLPDLAPLAMGVAMRGLWDSWLYVPECLSFVFPFQIERRMDAVFFGADTALAAIIPTGDDITGDTELALQLAGLVGGSTGPLKAGVRLQVVWVPTGNSDNAQVALVPFVQGDFSEGFVYLRFLVNLDERYGVFGDGIDVWALSIGGGGRF